MSSSSFNSYCYVLLNEHLNKRKVKNSLYSIRAFARDIGISKTTVSEVLRERRILSPANIKVIEKSLQLSQEEVDLLMNDSVIQQQRIGEMNLANRAESQQDYLTKFPIYVEMSLEHLKEVKKEIELFRKRLIKIQEKSSAEAQSSHKLCLSIIDY